MVTAAQYKARYYTDTATGAVFPRTQAMARIGLAHPTKLAAQRKEARSLGAVLPAKKQRFTPKPRARKPNPVLQQGPKRVDRAASARKGRATRARNAASYATFLRLWAIGQHTSTAKIAQSEDFQGAWQLWKHSYRVKDTTMTVYTDEFDNQLTYKEWLRRPMMNGINDPTLEFWVSYGPGDTPGSGE